MERVYLPESIKRINSGAFSYCCVLKDIQIPSRVVTIEPWTFCGCSQLEKVTFLNTIKLIKESSFSKCVNLKAINISENTEIEFKAFSGCMPEIAKLSPKFQIVKGRLIETDDDLEGHVCIPNGTRAIVEGAFDESWKKILKF